MQNKEREIKKIIVLIYILLNTNPKFPFFSFISFKRKTVGKIIKNKIDGKILAKIKLLLVFFKKKCFVSCHVTPSASFFLVLEGYL